MADNFFSEIKLIVEKIVELQAELINTQPGAPDLGCDCGRTIRQHLLDRLDALEVLLAVTQGDFVPLSMALEKSGPLFMIFMVAQIYQDMERANDLLERIKQSLQVGRSGATPNNGFGVWN